MLKRKQPLKKANPQTTVKEHLAAYDNITLNRVIEEFETGVAWTVYKSFLKRKQRESELTTLYKVSQPNGIAEASYASGYAKAMDDVTEGFITELINLVNNKSHAVENPMPEESEV